MRKDMRNKMYIWRRPAMFCLLGIVLLGACRKSPRMIPPETFKQIFVEAVLADSYLDSENAKYSRDTLRYFEPILASHGYTMDDLDYTIEKLALRKSNVFAILMRDATLEIDRLLERYRHFNKIDIRWNVKAQNLVRDTVLLVDSLRINSLADLSRGNLYVDNLLRGNYTITFYATVDSTDRNNDHYYYSHLYDTLAPYKPGMVRRNSNWISRTSRNRRIREERRIESGDMNRLRLELVNLGSKRAPQRPSVRIDSLTVVYDPPVEYARRRLMQKYLYDDSGKSLMIKYLKINEKDSSTLLDNFRPPVK